MNGNIYVKKKSYITWEYHSYFLLFMQCIKLEMILLVNTIIYFCSIDLCFYRYWWLYIWQVLKGPKLTDISPNKTYSGVAGSYIFSIFSAYLYIQKVELDYAMNNISEVIFIVLLISTVSQLGDLLISFFKRMSNLKDTGTIIPGHGGVLDRIDGMIFAIPFSYLIFSFNIFQL